MLRYVVVAALFLVSVVARRPLAERLAHDFCPLDPDVLVRPFVRRFFLRVSLLWGAVLATQAGFVLWLLLVSSLRAFVVERQLVNSVLTKPISMAALLDAVTAALHGELAGELATV